MKRKHEYYMKQAIELAEKARDKTYPNPMVGAVIVNNGRVIGRGYHKKAGKDHAEVAAIKASGNKCQGADMYVTLEPCDHYGKTPPCTKAIIESGIKKVYIAMKDPNLLNNGKGLKKLKKNGVKIVSGICKKEAETLNAKYIKFIEKKIPYITLKLGQSLDGKIAARNGSSKWITSKESRMYARKMRKNFDAVCVGANTAINDDPFLLDEKRKGFKTRRIILDSKLRLSLKSNLIKTAGLSPIIIGTTDIASERKVKSLNSIDNVEVIVIKNKKEQVDLNSFFKKLAKKNFVNILVEGGGELAGSLIDQGLVDEFFFFIAPKVIGGKYSSIKGKGVLDISKILNLKDIDIKRSGDDFIVRGLLCSQA